MGDETEMKTGGAEPPPESEAPISEAFRETFLFLFSPEDAQVFRRFVDVLQDRLLDRTAFQQRQPQTPYTLAELFAVTVDLRFVEKFLEAVGSERSLSELTPTEQALSELAEELAPEVRALAEKLERSTDQLISDDQDEPPQAE